MRLLLKLIKKLVLLAVMMAAMGFVAKYGWRFAMQASGTPQVSTEEADLMSTVFSSAVRLVTGSAKKEQLASELSDKLYAGRGNPEEMKELGIEMVRPGASPAASPGGGASSGPPPAVVAATPPTKVLPGGKSPLDDIRKKVPVTLLGKLWQRLGADGVGMALVPVAFAGMIVARKLRRKPSKMEEFMPFVAAMQDQGDSEPYEMQHAVRALGSEDFELLIALIYQRQGYRVSMSAGQSGGRGGDFILARKAERVLVQCKKLACEHRIAVERVREFHEAMVTAGFTRGLYVASCGYSWDARHFAKTRGITLINARTLDQLLTAARENPDEDLLAVNGWAPKLLQKITVTAALCPTCDAAMDEIVANGQTVWVCSQRPDCRGRRSARKHRKPAPGSTSAAPTCPPKPAVPRGVALIAATGKSVQAKPKTTKRATLPKIISKRVVVKPVEAKPAEAKPAVAESAAPAPAPPPEQEEPRPIALKSVVPRKRPLTARGPDHAGAGREVKRPITVFCAAPTIRRVPDPAPGQPAAGGVRPQERR